MNDDRLVKDGIELVAIDEKQLKAKELEHRIAEDRENQERHLKNLRDVKFIKQQEKETSKALEHRKKELEIFLEKKQQRSKDEFIIKQTVLKESFGDAIQRLIEQIKRQKDIIIKAYGPLMLTHKKEEPPLYQISKELDPVGYNWIKELNKAQTKIP